jgi:hypothetical protein
MLLHTMAAASDTHTNHITARIYQQPTHLWQIDAAGSGVLLATTIWLLQLLMQMQSLIWENSLQVPL